MKLAAACARMTTRLGAASRSKVGTTGAASNRSVRLIGGGDTAVTATEGGGCAGGGELSIGRSAAGRVGQTPGFDIAGARTPHEANVGGTQGPAIAAPHTHRHRQTGGAVEQSNRRAVRSSQPAIAPLQQRSEELVEGKS